jgi:hypothetical protein
MYFLLHSSFCHNETGQFSLEDPAVPTAFLSSECLFLQGLDMSQDIPYCHFQFHTFSQPPAPRHHFLIFEEKQFQGFKLCHLLSFLISVMPSS